jgi:hypothetical protein
MILKSPLACSRLENGLYYRFGSAGICSIGYQTRSSHHKGHNIMRRLRSIRHLLEGSDHCKAQGQHHTQRFFSLSLHLELEDGRTG